MKRTYYLAIAAVVLVAIVIFSLLNYAVLLVLFAKYFNSHNINVFFVTRQGKLIQNVSVSLFAYYPTPNGTVIKEIYQGFNLKYLSVPVSNLTWYAKQWLGTYNYTIVLPNGTELIMIYNASLIIPSLIGFASYYVINQTNGTMTIYTQVFSVRVSPRNIIHGIGKTVFKEFANPIVKVVKIEENRSSSSSYSITPQQITTTENSFSYITVLWKPGVAYEITYNLTAYWIYPSNSSQFGPIPLAVAYVTDPNSFDYLGVIKVDEYGYNSSHISISFGITLLSSAGFEVAGSSVSFRSGSISISNQVSLGERYHNFAEIYVLGQIAIVNYTEYLIAKIKQAEPFYVGNVTMFFITAVQAVGKKGAYLPALYIANMKIPISNSTIQSFFNEKLVYCGNSSHYSSNIFGPYIGVAILVKSLIDYSLNVLNVSVPGWVTLVVSPNVVIVPLSDDYLTTFAFVSLSNNIYYVYREETATPYNIGGNHSNISVFYFYVNYTS